MDSSATTGRAMSDENVKCQSMFSIFVKTNFTFYDKNKNIPLESPFLRLTESSSQKALSVATRPEKGHSSRSRCDGQPVGCVVSGHSQKRVYCSAGFCLGILFIVCFGIV